jgi:transcriptional regulator with GAF, ATPase, and Fis domain
MSQTDVHTAEQKFEQFLSKCFACMHSEESQSCIQLLLDQLTLFLRVHKSYILNKNNIDQIIFESSRLNSNDHENCILPIVEYAVNKSFSHKEGIIVEKNLNNETNNSESKVFVLSVPISLENAAEMCIQLIKKKEAGRFHNSDLRFVGRIAKIIAPILKMYVKDFEISNISETTLLEKELRANYDFSTIVGHNHKMIELLELVTKVMDVNVPVLIEGESGTGKEIIAHAIHNNSKRNKYPLVIINCGAIPENLLESEFFGHEKGAFTGATSKKIGQFEVANNGTIFLDEISTLNLAMQVKLLRVLQWSEFTPVGGIVPRKVNVRVIAASNQNIAELVKEKKFRADLYYRLNVLRLHIPPLRDRKDDIPILCQYFIKENCRKMEKPWVTISPGAMIVLMNYDFPGNVRELENIIQRALILCDGKEINYNYLPFEVKKSGKTTDIPNNISEIFKKAKKRVVEEFEKKYIIKMLLENRGIILRAAKKSGMYEANFRAKMKQYDIQVDDIFRRDRFIN